MLRTSLRHGRGRRQVSKFDTGQPGNAIPTFDVSNPNQVNVTFDRMMTFPLDLSQPDGGTGWSFVGQVSGEKTPNAVSILGQSLSFTFDDFPLGDEQLSVEVPPLASPRTNQGGYTAEGVYVVGASEPNGGLWFVSIAPQNMTANVNGSKIDFDGKPSSVAVLGILGQVNGLSNLEVVADQSPDGSAWTPVSGLSIDLGDIENNAGTAVFTRSERYVRARAIVTGDDSDVTGSALVGYLTSLPPGG